MPHRNCTIEICNSSGGYTLVNPRVFIESGGCDVPLPCVVGPYSSVSALFNKTTGSAAGSVGVFTYDLLNADLNDYSHVLAVMFSVPYDRNIYSNWFAVGVLERGSGCDYALYDLMYNASERSFVRAKADGSSVSFQGDYIIASASMSDAGEAVLRVELNDIGMF
ncbi:DELTA-sagatoxin-Srs1a-like [Neosynchiropus ocellatus]